MRLVLVAGLAAALVSASLAFADDWDDLRAALYYNQDEKVVALLDRGVSVNLRSGEGFTPLMIAAEQNDLAMVKYLLSRGANPALRNNNGRTAFDITTSAEIKRLILPPATDPIGRNAAPAKPIAPAATPATGKLRDPQVWKSARDAIWYNKLDELDRLLDAGLDINMTDDFGYSLLAVAADRGKADFVQHLLDRGANRNIATKKGERPVDLTQSQAVRDILGGTPRAPAAGNAYCTRLKDEALRLCGTSDSFCRTQALNKQQSCNKTGRWP